MGLGRPLGDHQRGRDLTVGQPSRDTVGERPSASGGASPGWMPAGPPARPPPQERMLRRAGRALRGRAGTEASNGHQAQARLGWGELSPPGELPAFTGRLARCAWAGQAPPLQGVRVILLRRWLRTSPHPASPRGRGWVRAPAKMRTRVNSRAPARLRDPGARACRAPTYRSHLLRAGKDGPGTHLGEETAPRGSLGAAHCEWTGVYAATGRGWAIGSATLAKVSASFSTSIRTASPSAYSPLRTRRARTFSTWR